MLLPIRPVPKPRLTQRDRWAKRPAVVRYYEFCDELRLLWGRREVPEALSITFIMPLPSSWSARKKLSMEGQPHKQRPDIDNLVKAFLDALCEDDSYVNELHAYKVWGSVGCIEVSLAEDSK